MGPSKSAFWRKKASKFLEEHSALIQQVRGEEEEEDGQESGSGRHEDGEDSQGLDQYAGDTPDELGQSSMEEEEEQEEDRDENGRGVGMALAERPKRNIQRKINVCMSSTYTDLFFVYLFIYLLLLLFYYIFFSSNTVGKKELERGDIAASSCDQQ